MALFAMLVGLPADQAYTGMIGPDSKWLPGYTIPFAVAREKISRTRSIGVKLVMCTVINSLFEDEKG